MSASGPKTEKMKNRYIDRERYFNELAQTSREFYIDYIGRHKELKKKSRILEIGCGEGGNLLPFAELGCHVEGLDLAPKKIENARMFFEARGQKGRFSCADFLNGTPPPEEERFDIIIIHDVIEHIEPESKRQFFEKAGLYLKPDGMIFFGFPAWQMPFGGHQQICRSKAARFPFVHLLPGPLYRAYLKMLKENDAQIEELMSIRRSKMTPERFESLTSEEGYRIIDRTLWFITPHYKAKFNLKPRRLALPFRAIPYIRNFLTTSCFYIIGKQI